MNIENLYERLARVETDVKWIKGHLLRAIENKPHWLMAGIATVAAIVSCVNVYLTSR